MRRLKFLSICLFIVSLLVFGVFQYKERIIKDQTGPVFSMSDDALTVSVKDSATALLEGITAVDAGDGDVTDSIIVEAVSPFTGTGHRIVSYAAFDSDNHVTHAKRSIMYSDYTPPKYSMHKPLAFPLNSTNLLEGIEASDCIDGDITRSIRMVADDEIDTSHVGEYNARLKVSNSAGGISYLPVTIEIYDASSRYRMPQLVLSDYIVYIEQGSDFDAEEYLKSATISSIEYTFVEDGGTYGVMYLPADRTEKTIDYRHVDIESDVDTDITGYYVVKYTFEDTVSNTGIGTARLYVVVTEGGED